MALSAEGEVCIASGALQDAVLWQDAPNFNDGAGAQISTGVSSAGGARRALIQFDTSGVPSGATVVSATMTLYQLFKNGPDTTEEVHRVTAPWSESTVTSGTMYNSFDPEVSASFLSSSTTIGARHVPITALAQAWVDGPNYGLLLDEPGATTATSFRSRESPNVDQRPSLSICYVTCDDGVQNGDEDGVDCGGSCEPCPSCDDGVQNGDETGVDCGGSCASCTPPPVCGNGVKEAGEQCDGTDVGVDCVIGLALCTSSCTLLLHLCIGPH